MTAMDNGLPAPIDAEARKVAMVQEYRMSHTREETRQFWKQLGLPDVEQQIDQDALACLKHFLDASWREKP